MINVCYLWPAAVIISTKLDVLLQWGKLRLVWDWQHLTWTGSRIRDERWITTTCKEHSNDRDYQRQTFWNIMVRNKQVPKSIFVHASVHMLDIGSNVFYNVGNGKNYLWSYNVFSLNFGCQSAQPLQQGSRKKGNLVPRTTRGPGWGCAWSASAIGLVVRSIRGVTMSASQYVLVSLTMF